MYFPYLRGKQNELSALKEEVSLLATKMDIIPIIEPVKKEMKGLIRTIEILNKMSAPFILIVNPQDGELADTEIDIDNHPKLKPNSSAYLGYLINYKSNLKDIRSFLENYRDEQICFIHFAEFRDLNSLKDLFSQYSNITFQIFVYDSSSMSYQNSFADSQRIIVKDCFKKAKKNSDYKNRTDEFFSDLHLTYKSLGFQGFGDFTVIGREYEEGGGPAYSVAIHFTYPNDLSQKDEIWIRHFVSEKLPDLPQDTAGKFLEALEKLIEFMETNPKLEICNACLEFQRLHKAQHFPQLGIVKKLSIKHHINVVKNLI